MGIRCDQFMGLPEAAIKFLAKNQAPLEVCKWCKREFGRELEVIGTFPGMFLDEYSLHRHMLKDGRHADEFLQAAPWSSGPVHFLGLRVSDGAVFEWDQKDIDNA
jgi:hypothetical protein